MRIMLVISGLGMGGAERVVTSLADRFAGTGHEVMLVALGGQDVVMPMHPAVRLVNLGVLRRPISAINGLLAIRRLVGEFAPDVVHSHMVHANLTMRFLRLVTPIKKLVSTVHSTDEEGRLRMVLYRLSDSLADISTNVSDEAVESFRRRRAFPAGRMITVHNGIDVDGFGFSQAQREFARAELQAADDCFLFVAVGRLAREKDYPNLLTALQRLPVDRKWRLVIVGDGELRETLVKQVRDCGLGDRVCFLGIRRDVSALLCAADAFVLSSAHEGFPMVVGEAMACERVVVATDCGGVSEFVGEQRQFIVPPRSPDLLAGAMTRVMDTSADERLAMGRSLRERVVANFSLDAAVERWLRLYRAGDATRYEANTQCAD